MDNSGSGRDTRPVDQLGGSRLRVAGVLNAAFAEGLLSEHTHSLRLGVLFSSRLVDQQRLIGDLTLRREPSSTLRIARESWRTLTASVRSTLGPSAPTRLPPLLALDRLDSDRVVVGRHATCDVVLGDASVSRRHAQLTFRGGAWTVQDLSSTNGTSVNGVRVGRTSLRAGDLLVLGSSALRID